MADLGMEATHSAGSRSLYTKPGLNGVGVCELARMQRAATDVIICAMANSENPPVHDTGTLVRDRTSICIHSVTRTWLALDICPRCDWP